MLNADGITPAILVGIGSLTVAVVGLWLSRRVQRRVQVKVHMAAFGGVPPICYFVNVTNVSLNREVEVTHVWFESSPPIPVLPEERPLPKRLKADESWQTWIEVGRLPAGVTVGEVYRLARVRLSTGQVFRSKQNKNVPSVGYVPGGDPPKA